MWDPPVPPLQAVTPSPAVTPMCVPSPAPNPSPDVFDGGRREKQGGEKEGRAPKCKEISKKPNQKKKKKPGLGLKPGVGGEGGEKYTGNNTAHIEK